MAPPATMLESAAYGRLRAENEPEFVPRSVVLHERASEIDRRNSLWVKAALVYESVTGRHVDDKSKPVATRLLLSVADICCSRIYPHDPTQTTTKSESGVIKKGEGAMVVAAPAVIAAPAALAASVAAASAPNVAGEDVGEENRQDQSSSIDEGENSKQATEFDDEGSDKKKRVIDGIFLVVGFLPMLHTPKATTTAAGGARKGVVSRDAVDERFKSTHMQDIVKDVIKLENQLPLEHLLAVVDNVEDAIHDAGTGSGFPGIEGCLKGYKLGFNTFDEVVRSFCWYYSPFFSKQAYSPFSGKQDSQLKNVADGGEKMVARTLLDCLHTSLVPRAADKKGAGGESSGKTSCMPTARELRRSGVRLEPGEDGRAAVEFDEQSSRLRLPALVYDFKLATVARNLLAREYGEQSKPVTRYFQMMNELVVEVADAKVLRRAGVLRGGSGGAHEVYELIKKIDGYASYPSVFMAMDVQIEKVKRFHDKRMQNFLVRYRPGVIWASSVAAVSVVAIVAARRKRA